jgi:hypothetical protein
MSSDTSLKSRVFGNFPTPRRQRGQVTGDLHFSGCAAMATGGNYSPAAENSQNASVPSAARGENQRKELVRQAPPIPKHNPVKDKNTPHRKILIREGS